MASSERRAALRAAAKSAIRPLETAIAYTVRTLVPPRVMREKRFFGLWESRGYHVTPVHYYEAIPDTRTLDVSGEPFPTIGIDLDVAAQLELLKRVGRYRTELDALPRDSPAADGYFVENSRFGPVDSEMLYALIRELRPARIVEVGAGYSTLVARRAVAANLGQGIETSLVSYDPYPPAFLRDDTPVVRARLQDIPHETFLQLGEQDVLFVDSSHVAAIGSDVTHLFLRVLPMLRSGVLVHVHDVFLPSDYPLEWVVRLRRFWNEQYLLHAFLAFNGDFQVVWSAAHMARSHPKELSEAVASFRPGVTSPGSFWIRRR